MKKFYILSLLLLGGILQYCSSSRKSSNAIGPAGSVVTYTASVQPLITAHCSPCHIPPKGSKLALDTYASAKENISDVIRRINMNPGERGFMPFKHDKLNDSVINVFVRWHAEGLQEK